MAALPRCATDKQVGGANQRKPRPCTVAMEFADARATLRLRCIHQLGIVRPSPCSRRQRRLSILQRTWSATCLDASKLCDGKAGKRTRYTNPGREGVRVWWFRGFFCCHLWCN